MARKVLFIGMLLSVSLFTLAQSDTTANMQIVAERNAQLGFRDTIDRMEHIDELLKN